MVQGIFTWLVPAVLAAGAITERQQVACASSVDGTCRGSEAVLTKDQALLQQMGIKSTLVKAQSHMVSSGTVRRRRREADMMACRRRHSSGWHLDKDLPWSPWKCNEQTNTMELSASPNANTGNDSIVGYPSTGVKKAAGLWCEVDIPGADWSLKTCPSSGSTLVKVLTYNLFWWNLFNRHHGSDRSAGRLISRTGGAEQYDMMGFQECEDVQRVLRDAQLEQDYETIDGGRAIAVAFRRSRWTMLDHGVRDVGEDSHDQYYGKRSAMWVRLQSREENKTVFFVNHHGPLKVSQRGGCTGSATAFNLLKLIGENARSRDVIIVVGDFNAAVRSTRIQEMEKHITRVHSGYFAGGVDHVFSNCGERGAGQTLEKGDGYYKSDHNALNAEFAI